MNPPLAHGDPASEPADPTTIGLVMGGSGIPLPDYNVPGYVQAANTLYIHPNFPDTTYPAPYENGLFTPEYPELSMPFSLNYPTATTGPLAGFPALSTSMGQGMLIVDNAIATNTAAGDASTVFGYSQSATIASLVMEQLDPTGTPKPDAGLQFVLIGDPSAPNGGILERFDGFAVPSLGISFDGATPADDFPTDIYTLEYDGYADFPRYPIDFLADLNAVLGTISLHGIYLELTPEEVATATLLPGSQALGADTLTNYYMIDETPPLVAVLSDVPVVGKPLAALFGPDLTVLINLGYGPGNLGYSLPANVPTEFGLFPDVSPITVAGELAAGAQQGISAFSNDLATVSLPALVSGVSATVDPALSLPSMTDLVTAVSAGLSDPATTLTDVTNALSSAGESLATLAMQTTDIVNAAVISLSGYDISLFDANLNNPIDAIGLPIAADTGLLTLVASIELELVYQAVTATISTMTAVVP
ncbi:PE-PPE domain-containing protein [Mycobacterium botniense]|nr:PE-PPE domain-containing protein [Mycobacterium botniense]